LESLSPWRKELLGVINTMKSSSIFKFLFYSYSNAYELEYSYAHVIITIYELVYSLYTMILTCSSPFFNIHIISMSRGITRVGVTVRSTFGFAHVLACQSVGLESRGDKGSSFVHGRGYSGAWEPANMTVPHG
jgi:hypothetical protein